jgi:hypothetical protein
MQLSVASLVGDQFLLRDFEAYRLMFMNGCIFITVAMVMLLRDFGPYVFCFRVGPLVTIHC